MYIPFPSSFLLLRLGLGFPAVLRWLPVLLLLWSGVGEGGCGGSGGVGTRASSSRGVLWRIKWDLVGSGGLRGALVLDVFPFVPSLDFVGAGDIFERYGYQLGKPGWIPTTTFSGGLLPFWVFYSPVCWWASACPAPRCPVKRWLLAFSPGMCVQRFHCMFVWACCPWRRSNLVKCLHRGGCRLQRLLRPPAMETTGKGLQGLVCNFYFLQGCLCKWVVNHWKN